MSEQAAEQQHTPEPIEILLGVGGAFELITPDGRVIAARNPWPSNAAMIHATGQRLRQCYNACRGPQDPEAALETARHSLSVAIDTLETHDIEPVIRKWLGDALALLQQQGK